MQILSCSAFAPEKASGVGGGGVFVQKLTPRRLIVTRRSLAGSKTEGVDRAPPKTRSFKSN